MGTKNAKEVPMANPYSYQLRHDPQGRIIEKAEAVAGRPAT